MGNGLGNAKTRSVLGLGAATALLLAVLTTGALFLLPAAALAHGARMTFPHAARKTSQTLAPLPPAPANTIWFHLVLNTRMRNVPRVERALVDQLDRVASAWGTPQIRFGAAGIPIYIQPVAAVEASCLTNEAAGCHDLTPQEAIHVENFAENVTLGNINQNSMTSALSHEIVETVVDPDGSRPEVCDPVAWRDYKVDGVVVSDWTLPSFWNHGTPPYDYLRSLPRT